MTAVGEPGTPTGVTASEEAEAAESPTPFVATTVNVYGVPLASPETVHVRAAVVQVFGDAPLDVTV